MASSAPKWTLQDVPKLEGRIVVITGANSGLGLDTAKALSSQGAEVVLACRSKANADEAMGDILSSNKNAKLKFLALDLQDLSSIADFAEAFAKEYDRLDILINNAGIMNTPYALTKDGFESQMGTNHLGHFALTGRLLPLLNKSEAGRVVTVSSTGHKIGKMSFSNLLFEKRGSYSPMKAYSRSKLANLLFAFELQRQFNRAGMNCISVAAHPGASQTNLGRYIEDATAMKLMSPLLRKVVQSSEKGALPQIRAAVEEGLNGGEYFGPRGFMELSGHPIQVRANSNALKVKDARALWSASEQLCGLSYAFDDM